MLLDERYDRAWHGRREGLKSDQMSKIKAEYEKVSKSWRKDTESGRARRSYGRLWEAKRSAKFGGAMAEKQTRPPMSGRQYLMQVRAHRAGALSRSVDIKEKVSWLPIGAYYGREWLRRITRRSSPDLPKSLMYARGGSRLPPIMHWDGEKYAALTWKPQTFIGLAIENIMIKSGTVSWYDNVHQPSDKSPMMMRIMDWLKKEGAVVGE